MQQLLPLAPHFGLRAQDAAALAAIDAEDVDGRHMEAVIEEGKQIFPFCETLWLYFRCKSNDKKKGWAPVQMTKLDTQWSDSVANAGTYNAGAHGLLIFVGIHVRGKFAPIEVPAAA